MKKLGILVALALVAGSASATIVLDDSQWATLGFDMAIGGAGTLDSSVDIAGDPGYQWTATVEDVIPLEVAPGVFYNYGLVRIANDTASLGVSTTPDVWTAEFHNPGAAAVGGVMSAYVTGTTNGIAFTGFINRPETDYLLNPGASATLSWDLTQTQDYGGVPLIITSVDKLGLMIAGGTDFGGNTVTLEVIPEPATLGMVGILGGAMLWIRKRSAK